MTPTAKATQKGKVSAISEIYDWSLDRPDWQQDALRRIISNNALSVSDLQELYTLCLSEHGITEPDRPAVIAVPLKVAHFPASSKQQTSVSLVSIGKLCGVNRLPPSESITFGNSPGLVVIYGDNGSGKSGYARVIKKACRTRGSLPEVRSDAFSSTTGKPQTGDIIFRVDNEEHSATWKNGSPCDAILSNIFVFDTATAANYLEQDGPATFTPKGLDILPKLSRTCDDINDLLKARIERIREQIRNSSANWKPSSTSAVGKLVADLSATTKTSDLDSLAGLNNEQKQRLNLLRETLKSDPRTKARETRASKKRLETFALLTVAAANNLSDERVTALKAAIENAESTAVLAKRFAAEQLDINDLPETKGEPWRSLWEAARSFSTAAYPENEFPVTENNARCVLCQQSLSPEAAAKLIAFDSFCKNKSQQLAKDAAATFKAAMEQVEELNELVNEFKKIESDLESTLDSNPQMVSAFVKAVDERLRVLKENFSKKYWTVPCPLPLDPSSHISNLAAGLEQRAKTEESAVDPVTRQKLVSESQDLSDREWLGGIKTDIQLQIERYKLISQLEKCQKNTTTKQITSKNSDLTKALITDAFCGRFQNEIDKIGLRTLSVKLQEIGGKKGETKFGLRLGDSIQASVLDIASEGEQRCIALAAFLAELSLASHQSALVFDDPVSSLDHWHRDKIAHRLVHESLLRQVIVFTHDPVFLNDLGSHADQLSIVPTYRSLDWKGSQPGFCNEGLPWECKSPEDRLDKIEKRQRKIAAVWGTRPSQDDIAKIRDVYGCLRATIERIVERVVFADVVFRFRSYINLKYLDATVGFPQNECDEIQRLFKKCCNITDAHDPAQGKQATVPEPKELKDDIDATNQLLLTIRNRHKTAKAAAKVNAVSP